MYLGQLGNLHHFRCSHCGIDWHLTEKEFQEYQEGGVKRGRWIECPVCRFSA
jgi:NAD-dependent SIR2 family protein deacetylase